METCLRIQPKHGRAHLLLAQTYQVQRRYWSAIEQYKLILTRDSSLATPIVLSPLALCYILDQRIQAGIIFFRDYIKKKPSPAVRITLAILLKHNQQRKEAATVLRAVTGDPEAAAAHKAHAAKLLATWEGK